MNILTQENGSVIVSVDAIFGLCQKKSAGNSLCDPLSGTTVFGPQEVVNSFVASQDLFRDASNEFSHMINFIKVVLYLVNL